MKWQTVAKLLGGTVPLVFILIGIFNLSGMTYSMPEDIYCGGDCYSEIQVNSTYWEIMVEHAGDRDIIFKKQTTSRRLWVNLDRIEEFMPTNPNIDVELLVPTIKKYATVNHDEYGYLRPVKDGDVLIARFSQKYHPNGDRFVIHGIKGKTQTVKWGLELESLLMQDIIIDPLWIGEEGGWRSPSWSNEVKEVVEFKNGSQGIVDFNEVSWNEINKAGLWIGDQKKMISGIDASKYGQIFLYDAKYNDAPIHTFVRVHAEKNSNTYTKWITRLDGIEPYFEEYPYEFQNVTGEEKELGYKRNLTVLGQTFPVSIGVRANTFGDKMKIPINFTTPISLDDIGMEYIIAVNPKFTEQAKKLKYIQITKKDYYNETTEQWNYTTERFELNQLLDKSGEVPNMTSSFVFLTENNKTISWIDFDYEFENADSIEWKIKQVTLPNGNTTYVLSLLFWFGSMNSGETLSLNADWTTPSGVSSSVGENSGREASDSIDDDLETWWSWGSMPFSQKALPYWIIYDMGSTKAIEGFRIYENHGALYFYPCKVTEAYVCDDSACSGESDLLSSDCSLSSDTAWNDCLFSETSGRYLKIVFGVYHQTSSTCVISGNAISQLFFEFDAYVATAPLLENGEACDTDEECDSGECTESVCCDLECAGDCESCLAANTPSTDGTCDDIDDGSDPDGECGTTNCFEGNCDGSGACDVYSGDEEGNCAACTYCNDGSADGSCDDMPNNAEDSDGSNKCEGSCVACQSGSCSIANIDSDPDADCGTTNCFTGDCNGTTAVCKVYDDDGEHNCGAACKYCNDGTADGSCDNMPNNAEDNVGTTCTGLCVACQSGTCGVANVDSDPDADCAATTCYTGNCNGTTGACKIYTGDEEGDCAVCYECSDADSDCDLIADHTQDDTGGNTCTDTCKECDGAGACDNQAVDQDYFTQCGIVECDGGAGTPYYDGWDTLECFYKTDESAADAKCDGSAACKVAADYCGDNAQGDTAGVTCDCEEGQIGCTGTTIGSCNNTICSAPDVNFGLNENITYKFTCDVDDGTVNGSMWGQNDTNAILWCHNNGTGTEDLQIRIIDEESQGSGWYVYVDDDNTVADSLLLTDTWQTFYTTLTEDTNDTTCAWFWASCDSGTSTHWKNMEIQAVEP